MRAAACPHAFLGVNEQGLASIVKTQGNPDVHVILRGGKEPNFQAKYVKEARETIEKARPGIHPAIMIDCSHGNCKYHIPPFFVLDHIVEIVFLLDFDTLQLRKIIVTKQK